MAFIALQPGFGGSYTASYTASSTLATADVIDCSRCNSVVFQFSTAGGAAGSLDVAESFNGSDFVLVGGSPITPSSDGHTVKISAQPLGMFRVDPTGITAGTVDLTIVGFPSQSNW